MNLLHTNVNTKRSLPTLKLSLLFLSILCILSFMTGCSSTKLSKSFDKDTVVKQSKTIVSDLNEKKYDSIVNMAADSIQGKLTSDVLSSAADKILKDAGKFKKFKDSSVLGQQNSKTKKDYAVCILQAKYDSKTITYTITYDTNMKLAGLYMK